MMATAIIYCAAAGRDLLRVPPSHGRRPDDGRRQGLTKAPRARGAEQQYALSSTPSHPNPGDVPAGRGRPAAARKSPGRSPSSCPIRRCSRPSSSIRSSTGCGWRSDPCALCRAVRRPATSGPWSTRAVRRPRREREDVPGVAAVRLLHASRAGGSGPARGLHAALGAAGAARLPLLPLDADRRAGAGRTACCASCSASTDRSGSTTAGWRWAQHRRLYLEVDAVLDADLPGRPDGDPAGHLRGGGGRRRHRRRAVSSMSCSRCWRTSIWSARCSPLWTVGDFTTAYLVSERRAGSFHRGAGHARLPLRLRRRATCARRRRDDVGPAGADPGRAAPDATRCRPARCSCEPRQPHACSAPPRRSAPAGGRTGCGAGSAPGWRRWSASCC